MEYLCFMSPCILHQKESNNILQINVVISWKKLFTSNNSTILFFKHLRDKNLAFFLSSSSFFFDSCFLSCFHYCSFLCFWLSWPDFVLCGFGLLKYLCNFFLSCSLLIPLILNFLLFYSFTLTQSRGITSRPT